MNLLVYVEFIFYFYIILATGLPVNGFIVTNSSSSTKTESLNSTKQNFSTTCHSNRCLHKCCKPDEIYNGSCSPDVNNQLQNSNWSTRFSKFEVLVIDRSWCPSKTKTLNSSLETEDYEVFSNGSLLLYAYGMLHNYSEYCMDFLKEDEIIGPVFCVPDSPDEISFRSTLIYYTEFKISILFLIITIGLYLATPRLRKNLHDKCCLFHSFSLAMGFSFLMIEPYVDVENYACGFVGYMIQFWMLASFFWLNIMCFDMWRSIDNIATLKESNVQKLFIYCLYAWGCPGLISIISLLANNYLSHDNPWKPGFAEKCCWFRSNIGNNSWMDPTFVYYYSIISITLLVNIYTFADTAITIWNQTKRWKQDKNADSRKHNGKNIRFTLYLKLFFVMGVYWMMEVITSYYKDGGSTFWLTIDFINMFQGVYIFLIFICNKRALTILKERFSTRK